MLKGKPSLVFESFRGIHSNWQVLSIAFALGMFFDELEVSYSPCRKLERLTGAFGQWLELSYIGAHRWRPLERDHF
jgi:hypothetical protein